MSVSLNSLTMGQLEGARTLFNVLLVAANVAVWAGVYLERDKFSEATKTWGWRTLLGGLAAETLAALLLWQVDSAIIARQGATLEAILHTTTTAKINAAAALGSARAAQFHIADISRSEAALHAAIAQDAAEIENEQVALNAERMLRAPRALSRAQYNAIQTLRGKIVAVRIGWENDTECMSFAVQITNAFEKAGIRVDGGVSFPGIRAAGNTIIWEKAIPANPDDDPLLRVFQKMNLVNSWSSFSVTPWADNGSGEPVIFVIERPFLFARFPYFGPPEPKAKRP